MQDNNAYAGEMDKEALLNECKSEMAYFKKDALMPLCDDEGKYNNPLTWWKVNQRKFPVLARLARKLLAIPATSAPSERIWSRAAGIVTMKRASLKPYLAQSLMYIRENLSFLHKHYVSLATEDRGAIESDLIEIEKEYLPPLECLGGDIDVGQAEFDHVE
jgi:hypothetical protein